ncbi:Cthe_2314 family HEPN domain-containing protein [Peribacillus sp. NPDC096540]|uniref:Cthe_2314 family HEPN domain-containing protein n=1 Tax=Peribacillus sp. NPDC096540 TaxID=3390612 RepID=UPI003D04FBAA
MDIYDYAKYPAKEDWLEICKDKADALDKLHLNIDKKKFNILKFNEAYHGMKLNYWLQEFNNRSFDLIVNYTMLKSYYLAGIPDDEWYKSPGENGYMVQYFPHFEEEHHANLYWFGFYMDGYYSRFSGLIDSVYHLINTKYKFEIEHKLGFIKKVLTKLKVEDRVLYDFLNDLPNNEVYIKVNEFRNNLIHNYRPNQIDSGFSKETKPDGTQVMKMSVGNYTTSKEFMINIDNSLDLLANITDTIRNKVKEE